jgi:hypothetical protein
MEENNTSADEIDLDVEIKPSIPELKIPEFKPHISPEEVSTFTQRDQKLLLAFSVAAQQLEFILAYLREENRYARALELEIIRLKIVVSELRTWQKTFKRRWILALSLLVTTLTAAASALGSWLVQHFTGGTP